MKRLRMVAVLATGVGVAAWGQGGAFGLTVGLNVDLRDAPKKVIHAVETIPVSAGPLTLVYPKWIPGEHGPTGPIDNQAGLVITGNGQPVKWERDPLEMYSFHVTGAERRDGAAGKDGLPGGSEWS